jgi:hypothetical protein
MVDTQKVPSSVVFTCAKDVISDHKAGRRYGLKSNTEMLKEEIINAIYKSSDRRLVFFCQQWTIKTNYFIVGKWY